MTVARQKSPRLTRRRIMLLVVIVTLLFGWVLFEFLTDPVRLGRWLGGLISRRLDCQVQVARVDWTWSGLLSMKNVVVTDDRLPGDAGRLMDAQQVDLSVSWLDLFQGRCVVRSVHMVGRTRVWVTELTDHPVWQFNLQCLMPGYTVRPHVLTEDQPLLLPPVRIDRLVVCSGVWDQEHYRSRGELVFHARLYEHRGRLALLVKGLSGRLAEMPVALGWVDRMKLSGHLTARDMQLDAVLTGMPVDPTVAELMPRSVAEQWRRFAPHGNSPKIRLRYQYGQGFRLGFDVSQLTLRLPPMGSTRLQFGVSRQGQPVLMEQTRLSLQIDHGKIVLEPDAISVPDLVGVLKPERQIHGYMHDVPGLEYRMSGIWHGYDIDSTFEFTAETRWFKVDTDVYTRLSLPDPLVKVFQMLEPEGELQLKLQAYRRKVGQIPNFQGQAQLREGRLRYRRIPYPLRDCRGTIRFDSDRIRLENFQAKGLHGGQVTMGGQIRRASHLHAFGFEDAAVQLQATARDIPIDRTLLQAFEPHIQREIKAYMSTSALKRLEGQGLVNQEGSTDRFSLGGTVDFTARVDGPAGDESLRRWQVDASLDGVGVLADEFAYPMVVQGGRIKFSAEQVQFDQLQLKAVHGGTLTAVGRIDLEDDGRTVHPHLVVHCQQVPFGQPLIAALPAGAGQWLEKLQLAGRFNADFQMRTDLQGSVARQCELRLKDVTARPDNIATMTDLQGKLRVTDQGMEILTPIQGRMDDGSFQVKGRMSFARPNRSALLQLTLDMKRLKLEGRFMDVLCSLASGGESYDQFRRRLAPRGEFDGQLTFNFTEGRGEDWRFVMRPKTLSFTYRDRRLDFRDVAGSIVLTEGRATFRSFKAAFDGGRVNATASMVFADQTRFSASMEVWADRLTDSFKTLLPEALVHLLEELKVDGRFHARINQLTIDPDADTTKLLSRGSLEIQRGACDLGVPIRDFDGRIHFQIQGRQLDRVPALTLGIEAERLRVGGRQITDFEAALQSQSVAGQSDRYVLVMPQMKGKCYGGSIVGKATVDVDRRRYQIFLTAEQVDMRLLGREGMKALSGPRAGAEPGSDGRSAPLPPIQGKMSAHLSQEGQWGEHAHRRGRGDMVIRNARLYRLPIAVGVLQLASLALPVADSFHSVRISFYQKDDRLNFEHLDFRTPSLILSGQGWLDFQTGRLNLQFTPSNPNALTLGKVGELLEGLQDELVMLQVGGTLEKPETRLRQFNALSNAWEDVFKSQP